MTTYVQQSGAVTPGNVAVFSTNGVIEDGGPTPPISGIENVVQQSGSITVGHVAVWAANGVIEDGGPGGGGAPVGDQPANTVYAGPTSGPAAPPTFRFLVADDIPAVINTITIDGDLTVTGTADINVLIVTDFLVDEITGNADPFIIQGKPSLAATGGSVILRGGAATGTDQDGGALTIIGGAGTRLGGNLTLSTPNSVSGNGPNLIIAPGNAGTAGRGGNVNVNLSSGAGASGNAGSIFVNAGTAAGTGTVSVFGARVPVQAYRLEVNNNLTITAPGALSAANAWFYSAQQIFGNSSATTFAPFNFTASDFMNISGSNGGYAMRVQWAPQASMAGPRTAGVFGVNSQIASNPGDGSTRQMTGVAGFASSSVNQSGRLDRVTGIGNLNGVGALTSVFGQTILRPGGTAYDYITGAEIVAFAQAGASMQSRVGLRASAASSNYMRGTINDAAIQVGEQHKLGRSPVGWGYAFQVGSRVSGFPLTGTSGVFALQPRFYGAIDMPSIGTGFDLGWAGVQQGVPGITSGGFAWASPNASIDDVGGVYGNGLWTTGSVQARTATVTSVVVSDPGAYVQTAFPSFIVFDPPSGGTTAVVAVATMKGVGIAAYGNSGRNFTPGTTLTALTAGTGSSPSWIVATVNGANGITSLTLASNGSWTVPPANPIQLTDGASNLTAWINILAYTNNGTTFVPTDWEFASTGRAHAVGDVLTIAGDTGTGATYRVRAVTSDGGLTYTYTESTFTGSIASGTPPVLTVTAVLTGVVSLNGLITTGAAANTAIVTQLSGPSGGAGTYSVSVDQTVSLTSMAITSPLEPALDLVAAGSVTAIAAGTYHTVTSTGSGTGSTVQPKYGVNTATATTPGAGYPLKPVPKIYSTTTTSFRQAELVPVMTGATTELGLNPLGGSVRIGTAGSAIGKLLLAGNTSGVITISPQAAAGTYEFDLPITAGTAGQALLSGGGAGSPMTWGDIATIVSAIGAPILLGSLIGADLNITTDQAIVLNLRGKTRWWGTGNATSVGAIIMTNASGTVTTATGGIYTAAAKSGAIIPNTQSWATAATTGIVKSTWSTTPGITMQTASTIYFSLTTPEGSAKTADIYVYGFLLP